MAVLAAALIVVVMTFPTSSPIRACEYCYPRLVPSASRTYGTLA